MSCSGTVFLHSHLSAGGKRNPSISALFNAHSYKNVCVLCERRLPRADGGLSRSNVRWLGCTECLRGEWCPLCTPRPRSATLGGIQRGDVLFCVRLSVTLGSVDPSMPINHMSCVFFVNMDLCLFSHRADLGSFVVVFVLLLSQKC